MRQTGGGKNEGIAVSSSLLPNMMHSIVVTNMLVFSKRWSLISEDILPKSFLVYSMLELDLFLEIFLSVLYFSSGFPFQTCRYGSWPDPRCARTVTHPWPDHVLSLSLSQSLRLKNNEKAWFMKTLQVFNISFQRVFFSFFFFIFCPSLDGQQALKIF